MKLNFILNLFEYYIPKGKEIENMFYSEHPKDSFDSYRIMLNLRKYGYNFNKPNFNQYSNTYFRKTIKNHIEHYITDVRRYIKNELNLLCRFKTSKTTLSSYIKVTGDKKNFVYIRISDHKLSKASEDILNGKHCLTLSYYGYLDAFNKVRIKKFIDEYLVIDKTEEL